jgi:hypothetical protein
MSRMKSRPATAAAVLPSAMGPSLLAPMWQIQA